MKRIWIPQVIVCAKEGIPIRSENEDGVPRLRTKSFPTGLSDGTEAAQGNFSLISRPTGPLCMAYFLLSYSAILMKRRR